MENLGVSTSCSWFQGWEATFSVLPLVSCFKLIAMWDLVVDSLRGDLHLRKGDILPRGGF